MLLCSSRKNTKEGKRKVLSVMLSGLSILLSDTSTRESSLSPQTEPAFLMSSLILLVSAALSLPTIKQRTKHWPPPNDRTSAAWYCRHRMTGRNQRLWLNNSDKLNDMQSPNLLKAELKPGLPHDHPCPTAKNTNAKVKLRRVIVLRRGALELTGNVSQEGAAWICICQDVRRIWCAAAECSGWRLWRWNSLW